MWKNPAVPDRPYITPRRMRIACWIPKSTNTLPEYVMHISFPPYRLLHDPASLLRFIYPITGFINRKQRFFYLQKKENSLGHCQYYSGSHRTKRHNLDITFPSTARVIAIVNCLPARLWLGPIHLRVQWTTIFSLELKWAGCGGGDADVSPYLRWRLRRNGSAQITSVSHTHFLHGIHSTLFTFHRAPCSLVQVT